MGDSHIGMHCVPIRCPWNRLCRQKSILHLALLCFTYARTFFIKIRFEFILYDGRTVTGTEHRKTKPRMTKCSMSKSRKWQNVETQNVKSVKTSKVTKCKMWQICTNTMLHFPSFLHAACNLLQDACNLAQDARTTISVA